MAIYVGIAPDIVTVLLPAVPPSSHVYGSVTGLFSIVMNEQPIGVPSCDTSTKSDGKYMIIVLEAGTSSVSQGVRLSEASKLRVIVKV